MFSSLKYLIASGLCCLIFSSQAVTPFKANEKVLFLGDSITHGGDYLYWTQAMYQLRRGGRLRLENAGVSGDSARAGFARLNYDVLGKKPDRIFIMFGMNDIGVNLYAKGGTGLDSKRQARLNSYKQYMNLLCNRLKKEGIPVVLITPTPYDQYGRNNPSTYNEVGLKKAAEIVRQTAKERKLELVDFYTPMTEVIKKRPKFSPIRTDKIHPNPLGHLYMAYYLCKAAGLDGRIAEVRINAADGKVKKAESAALKDVKIRKSGKTSTGISFSYSPRRLPFITNKKQHEGIDTLVPFTADFNTELLQITGLSKGKYQLLANGRAIAVFTSADLEKGVNLALLDTPARKKAQKIFAQINIIRNCFRRLRSVVQCDRLAMAFKADVNDPQSCFKALDKWFSVRFAKGGRNKGYYARVIKSYKKDKLLIGETVKKLDEAYKNLHQINHTVSYKLELKKQ